MSGPANTLRVALERVPWPLDPATATTRDERTLVRALYPTALRVDSASHDIVSGLCSTWRTKDERTWVFSCTHVRELAAELRRLHSWLLVGAVISTHGRELRVRLPFRWVRFPYALTAAQTAVPGLPGPFGVVRAKPGLVVARRGALTVEFRQVEAHRAAQLFRQGKLDEAPVALGDIRAAQLDPTVAPSVRVRQLLAVDAVLPDGIASPAIRRVWWQTADRADYAALVSESQAPAAVSLVPGWAPLRVRPSDFRVAKKKLLSLPLFRLRSSPELAYGAALLAAAWRDLHPVAGDYRDPARLVRLAAPYPLDEAILAQVVSRPSVVGTQAQHDAFVRADDALYASAHVIPIAWVVDARLVSPRVQGWREDSLGEVDYARVTVR
ncbi:MAG: periplasmic substrate-binding domain-containing protein [Gaiellaceae bacterium]